MILHENSLYKDQTEKAAFIADKEKCANSLVYNFFGFLSLYNISEKKTQMKRYLSNEKDTADVKLIGDENADVSLAVKLAVDSTGLPFRTAKYMLKLLTKINQRTLKADDIDENAIRELVKYSKLQTSFKPSPALVSIINDFMDGTTNLTFLGYHLFKVQKRFTDINQEFVDYYKKGHYNTLYSDYQHGKLTCPDGIPQSQVKTVSNLTKIYVMNGGTQTPAPMTTTQPTPTVASVTPTQTVAPTATVTQTVPVAQAAPVVPQPTQTPVPVALPQPKIVTSPIATPVVVQQPVYKYNNITQVIESLKTKSFKIQECDVSSVKQSVTDFNVVSSDTFMSSKIAFSNCTTEREHIEQLEYVLQVFSSFIDGSDIKYTHYKHFITVMFVSILLQVGSGTLTGDIGVTSYTRYSSKFKYAPLVAFVDKNGLFKDMSVFFQNAIDSTVFHNVDNMYKYVSQSGESTVVQRTTLEIFASMIYGDDLTTEQFFNVYKRVIKPTNCRTFVEAFLVNAVPEKRTDLILELLKILGITNAENVASPNGVRFEYDAIKIPPVSEGIIKLFAEYTVFIAEKKPLDISTVSQDELQKIEYQTFYDFLMNDTVDLGGSYVSLLDHYIGGMYNNIRPMPETFVGLYDRLKETIEYINNKYDQNISTSDSNLDSILYRLFSQSTNNLVGIYYKPQVFSPTSLKEIPLARIKPILDMMLNFYSRFSGSHSDYPLFMYANSGRTNINKMYTSDTSNETVQYYANGIITAILNNKRLPTLSRVVSEVTRIITNLGSGNFNTTELFDAHYIVSASALYFLGKRMVSSTDTASLVTSSVIKDADSLWQAASEYKRGVRDKLVKYKEALPALGDMIELCDMAFDGVQNDVKGRYAPDTGDAFDEAVRFMILGEHPKYEEMSTYGVSSFLSNIQNQITAESPRYNALMCDVIEKMFLDPNITDDACAAMFVDIIEDSRYNFRDSAFLVLIDTLENPAYASRLNAISKAKAFSTVSHRQLLDCNDFFSLTDKNGDIVTGKEMMARVANIFKPDSENATLLGNIVERTIKSKDDYIKATIREFDRWYLLGMLPDNDFRKDLFKELDGYNAVKGREVIAYSESFKNVSLRDGITKFDVLGTGITKDEMKVVYDFLMQYVTNAITGKVENFMALSYINVVQMIKRIEDVHGFTSKLTAAKLEKVRTNGVIAFSSESKGGDKVFRGAGFTLSDMMKSDFPIVPNIGRRKGDFSKAIERNQPSPDPLNYVVKPHFLQEKNYRVLFDMILDGDLYDGNDSKKLQELRPLCVKPVVMSQDEMNKRTKQLMTTRRSGNAHGEAIPKITSVFDVDFNMTNMEFKPHTKEALDNFVTVNKVDKNDVKQYLKVAFHGTGSMAASFILRFGFKDTGVIVQGAGNAGQMLGDGMYLATNIDKAGLYAWDGGVSHNNYGEKGYIFVCEAALGTKDKHYKYADPTVKGFHKLRSREWCLKQPRQQVWIKKAYQIDIVQSNTKEYGYGVDWQTMPDTTIDY